MAKRKKPSPLTVSVEAIIWNDASFELKEKLDTSPVLLHTVGFVVHEDAQQVLLAHEVGSVEDWMHEDMDYTRIPVSLILQRTKLAEVSVMREEEAEK